ncbi:MAG: DUF2321 domain-containing protein [Candidatus Tumulicola sp.]
MEHTREALGLSGPDRMAVCLNGDVVSDSVNRHPQDSATYCPDCGAKVIDACPSCATPIAESGDRPSNCRACGKPFPWAKRKPKEVEADDVDTIVVYAVHRILRGASFSAGHLLEAVPQLDNEALQATADAAVRRGFFVKNDKRFSVTLDGRRHANRVLDKIGLRPRLYGLGFVTGLPTLGDAILLYSLSNERQRGPIWFEELYVQFPAVGADTLKNAIRNLRDEGLMATYDQTFLQRVANGERRGWEIELASGVTPDGIRRRALLLDDRRNADLMERPVNLQKPVRIALDEVEDFLRAVPRGVRELAAEHRYNGRPPFVVNDEYDLQDFVRAFLKMRFPKATFENSVGKVAGQSGRVDFALGDEKVFVELKVFRSEADWKKTMLPDLTSKIERYARDPKCETFFILVYDPEQRFRDAAAAEAELSGPRTIASKEINVRLIVTPQP